MAKAYKPGEIVPASAQVEVIGPRGGAGRAKRRRGRLTRGERFPPKPERGQRYVIVDRTKNDSGRRK